jgi:ribosome maturation factor RimP
MVGPRYVLEVSSPGIERPLRWPEHWRRFVGRRARVRSRAIGGRRQVEIVAVPDDGHVTLRPEGGSEVTVALDDIHEATLVVDFAMPRKPGSTSR